MWSALAMIISAIVGFSSGSSGLSPTATSKFPKVPITPYIQQDCYNPQPDMKVTLKWPVNFTNIPDYRPVLNPGLWGDKLSATENNDNQLALSDTDPNVLSAQTNRTFDATDECKVMAMDNKTDRTYILVRKDVRISSCKTDELAGPFANGICHGWDENAPELTHRGMCALDGYTDLRKIAQATDQDGKPVEIFWNPFSYNVGCNYKQDDNCGPGQRRNLNLKDFIYVLRRRDAVEPDKFRSGCPARWDAGSTDGDACSHYFDVYMANDLYEAEKSAPATEDPESPYYFIRQVLQNCKEDIRYIPAAEANLTMPPIFIKTPFYAQNVPITYSEGKIIPTTMVEKVTNYLTYIWGRADLIIPFKSNLLIETTIDNDKPLDTCPAGAANTLSALSIMNLDGAPTTAPPTITPLSNCYDSLGKIFFKDDKGKIVEFNAYSKPTSPEHFYLVKKDDLSKIYSYVPTQKDYPSNFERDPSLQLRKMELIAKNTWTWATPWCKPAIYLYPEKPTDINVKLKLDGQITVSNPRYNSDSGWNVFALPDGTIKLPLNLSEYPYLYYEADLNDVNIPKVGWVFSKTDLPKSLKSLMYQIGFNEKETADFMNYWLPRLSEKPYYFVTLLPEDMINEKEQLNFSITPDTLIRSRFVFEGLDVPMSVPPPADIISQKRLGFTVTDWGGTLVGKSCTDITVK